MGDQEAGAAQVQRGRSDGNGGHRETVTRSQEESHRSQGAPPQGWIRSEATCARSDHQMVCPYGLGSSDLLAESWIWCTCHHWGAGGDQMSPLGKWPSYGTALLSPHPKPRPSEGSAVLSTAFSTVSPEGTVSDVSSHDSANSRKEGVSRYLGVSWAVISS